MERAGEPSVMLLDGDFDNTLQVAKELSRDLDARVVGVGTCPLSRLLHSRYCDVAETAPVPGSDGYADALASLVRTHRPDVVLPVGFDSVVALDAIRERVPDDVVHSLPPPDALEVAVDKRRTLAAARSSGIQVPTDYTAQVAEMDGEGRPVDALDDLPFPLFLKARHEVSEALTAKVDDPSAFWPTYDDLRRRSGGDEILVQEYLPGDGRTYGCGLLFVDGSLRFTFEHAELRSVPRRGGSGTRLRPMDDPELGTLTAGFLEGLDWNGVALAEYRRTADGYVLMEVNPKFWASYALASQSGFRFASTYVAEALGLEGAPTPPATVPADERVFPLREMKYWLRHRREESLPQCLRAMSVPPWRWDVNVEDLRAWLLPPAGLVRDSRVVESLLGGGPGTNGSSPGRTADGCSTPGEKGPASGESLPVDGPPASEAADDSGRSADD